LKKDSSITVNSGMMVINAVGKITGMDVPRITRGLGGKTPGYPIMY
jgi:hypothetical protein